MTDILSRPKIPPPPLPPPHTSSSYNEDTDGSEADTALNTPTSWTTDHSNRWSLASAMSTAFSRHSFIHHKKKRSNDIHHQSTTTSSSPPTLPPRPVSTYHIPSSSTSISHKSSSPPLPSYTYRASWAPRTLSSAASDGSLKLALDDDHHHSNNNNNGYLSVNAAATTTAPPPLPKHDGRPPTPPRHHDDHPPPHHHHDSYLHVVEDPFEGASWSGSDLRQLLHEDNHDYHNSRSSFLLQHPNGSSVSNISSTNSSSGTTNSPITHSTESTRSSSSSKRACDHEMVRVAKLLSAVYEFENRPQMHQEPQQVQDFCGHLRQLLEDWAEQPTTAVGSMAARRLKRDNHNVATRTNMAANAATVGGTLLYYNVRHAHYYRRRRLRRQQTSILRQRVRQRRQQRVNHHDNDDDDDKNEDDGHHEQVAQLQQRVDKAEAETRAAQQATRLVQADMHEKIQQSQATLRIQMAYLEQALATVQRDRDTIEQRTLDQMRQQQYHAIDDPSTTPSNDTDGLRLQVIELESRCNRIQKNHDQERLRLQRAVDNATDRQTQAEYAVQGLKTSLSAAEKTVAELELKLEVAKSMAKKQQEEQQAKMMEADHTSCRQNEMNLQREIAAQQAEVSRLERSLQQLSEQHQREIAAQRTEIAHLQQSLQQLSEQQQRERGAWEQKLREEFSALYYHEKEAYKVQVSREMRMLANKVAEQEADLESMERRQQQDAKAVATAESMRRAIEARCNEKRVAWEDEEKKLRMTIVGLEQKVSRLEQDALQLYSRNLKLAHQLGQCAP
ncbi:hypothetical protein O0I10_001503 [Lichtheimia ornata]|uniref:Uncharacterized protein n=1 Tax=Lichtheimia ornata TaxID=688661 RepID=A0AAD7Y2V1_9FUNG|nr:uncharacterized protein O0I10_001503 [Lichtheimia ornata]KAJ8662542.1 hypothetical protein O0I10_001503 [Lichtheimia ornata]